MKPIARCIALFLFSLPLFADIRVAVPNGVAVRAEPGLPVDVIVQIANSGPDIALDAKVTIALPAGTTVTSIADVPQDWTCSAEAPGIVCTTPAVAVNRDSVTLAKFAVVVPEEHAGKDFRLPITFTSNGVPSLPFAYEMMVARVAHVTTTADAGAGSLRSAIETLNGGSCENRCVVRIDVPAGSRFEPLTPLPAITGCGTTEIPGGVETREGAHPFELSGARVAGGNGLEVRRGDCAPDVRTSARITGLAINGFPEDGLHVHDADASCLACFIGTDVTGTLPKPNGSRGVGLESGATLNVSQSIVSGNLRSGIFVWSSSRVFVYDTWIGLGANGEPLPNGASGIYVNEGDLDMSVSRIAYNRHFGVGFGAKGYGTWSRSSIYSNGLQAIDYGLDGPALIGQYAPETPVLIDATYDAAHDTTLIHGFVDITHVDGELYMLAAYASSTANSAETHLDYDMWVPALTGLQYFTMPVRGDQRGKIITANLGVGMWIDGSVLISGELSNGVEVTLDERAVASVP